jgi:hypothetical protein
MSRYLLQLLIVWWIAPGAAALSAPSLPEQTLRFDVTDPRETITVEIDSTLLLRVVRITHSRVAYFGWEVQVAERGSGSVETNVLRRGIPSDGPHPSDVLAWLSRERHFPDDRRLPVPGYPYEIRIRLIDCRTTRVGEDTGFVSGSVEITWHRLDLAVNQTLDRITRPAANPQKAGGPAIRYRSPRRATPSDSTKDRDAPPPPHPAR